MSVSFSESKTKENLMRAFAGESQARNRYTFAAQKAKSDKLHIIEAIFTFTASQEQAHAKVYYDYLTELSGTKIEIDGTYPVDIYDNVFKLLRSSQNNEYEEYNDVYKNFAEIAKEEGFDEISNTFKMISEVEKTHGDRFSMYADLIEQNKLFISDVDTKWM
ncbi:MAG: rubrerythrin family protein, partial [Oscillospiraceae bacterium]